MHGCVYTMMRIWFEVSREFWQDMPCDMEGVELAEVAVPLPMDIAVGASCPVSVALWIPAWQLKQCN